MHTQLHKINLTTNSSTIFTAYDPAPRNYQRSQFIKKKKKKRKEASHMTGERIESTSLISPVDHRLLRCQ